MQTSSGSSAYMTVCLLDHDAAGAPHCPRPVCSHAVSAICYSLFAFVRSMSACVRSRAVFDPVREGALEASLVFLH